MLDPNDRNRVCGGLLGGSSSKSNLERLTIPPVPRHDSPAPDPRVTILLPPDSEMAPVCKDVYPVSSPPSCTPM